LTRLAEHRSAILVDPHPLWLDAVGRVLDTVGIETRAKLPTVAAASGCLAELWPDLVVAETAAEEDLEAGRVWVRHVAAEFPETRIVVLSACTDEAHIAATLSSGATAYVLKKTRIEDLAATVRQLFDRTVFLRPPRATAPASAPAPPPLIRLLTPREIDILRLAAEGYANARIARILWVTEQTVKFHLSNIYRKINVTNRTEASHWAQLHGLLDGNPAERTDQVA
jgi:DNA-binding NarL/FixJ family response regulator